MIRALLLLTALGGMTPPSDVCAQEKPLPPPDAFDLVYVPDSGPVLIRIQARIGAESAEAGFRAYLKKWFDFLDTNRDGKLDARELTGAPKAATMAQLLRGGSRGAPRYPSLTLADLKKAGGETATLEDFSRYYQRNNVRALQITPTFRGRQFADHAGEALFRILDTNKDGKLSREELAAAPLLLGKYDLDDDELISAAELAAPASGSMAGSRPAMAMAMERTEGPKAAGNSLGMSFYPLVNQGDRDRLPEILLALFDKDDNDKLSAKESGLDAAAFARLDKNKDGELDLDELAEWVKGPADLEFVLVSPPEGGATLNLKAAGARFAKSCQQVSLVSCIVNIGAAGITVQGRDTGSVSALNQIQELLQQFEMADKDERGYVELTDLQDPSLQFLMDFFALMDRNNDGKVTEEEVRNLGLLLGEAPRYQAALAVFEQGPAFFQLLDANRDGHLSLHELRSAWSRLEALDVDKKGYVTIKQIPQHFQIVVTRGSSQDLFNLGASGLRGMGQPAVRALLPSNAPEWFRKMDANGDGFVSRREFLGSRAEFSRIDSNGDGLIDPQEAIRFDALVRKTP